MLLAAADVVLTSEAEVFLNASPWALMLDATSKVVSKIINAERKDITKTNLLIDEVSEVLDIPVFDLFKGLSNFKYKNFSDSYSFRYNSEIIWGATARILKQIRDCFYWYFKLTSAFQFFLLYSI